MKNKGISLIVLIITIVVIIILATAIIVNLAQTNIIGNANEATVKQDFKSMQEELNLYIADQFANTKGTLDITTIDADTVDGVKAILKSSSKSKYIEYVRIVDGEIVFVEGMDNQVKDWASEVINGGDIKTESSDVVVQTVNPFLDITKVGDKISINWEGTNFNEGLVETTSFLTEANSISENTWEIPFTCISYDTAKKEAVLMSDYVLANSLFYSATDSEKSTGLRASDGKPVNTYEGSIVEKWINSVFKDGLEEQFAPYINYYGLLKSEWVDTSAHKLAYTYKTTSKSGFWTEIIDSGDNIRIQTLDANYPDYTYWPVTVYKWTDGIRPVIVVNCNDERKTANLNSFNNITKVGSQASITWSGSDFTDGLVETTSFLTEANSISENTWEIPFTCIKYDKANNEAVLMSDYVLANSLFYSATDSEKSSNLRASDSKAVNTYEGSTVEKWINSTFINGITSDVKSKIKYAGLLKSDWIDTSAHKLTYRYKTNSISGYWTEILTPGNKCCIETLDANYPNYTYWTVTVYKWTDGIRPVIVINLND